MAETMTLQRLTSMVTESSYSADTDKEKVDEANNVGYTTYKEGLNSEITSSQNRSIRWRIDLIILPIFLITQTLQFLDKTALNYANLFGFQTDLKLRGDQFNWLGSMYIVISLSFQCVLMLFRVYFGYAIAQYPAQILIGKYPAQRVLSGAVFIWGLCVLTMVWCTNFKTAMINRFFLGIFEAFVSPCLTLMTGWWYTRQELPLRQFIWYSGLGWGGVIGSYVSTGISAISDSHAGPEKWQYIFYILGSVTMAWAVAVFFLLPDSPASAHFFSPEYRVLAVQRVAGNQLGIKNRKFKKEQILVSTTDPKIIILFISVFAAAIPNGVVSNFSSIIIKDMGFSTTKTTVLKSVGDMVQIAALIVGGVITLNVRNSRLMAATAANIICVVSAACMAYLPREHVWQRLVSFWLVNCQSVGFSVGLVMVSSNMGGYTHRTLASAAIFTAYCFGNVAGPFVVKQSQAPFFQSATAGLLAGYSIKLVCQVVLFIYMLGFNKRRDRIYGPPDIAKSKEAGMQDKTEWENTDFRYVL
ncbi:MFS general substrate transporter [Guyanagaster necrorhizus]|uniref:MFS general substrate transporter n=1 Tax=Guyanagaster necrorhizus TaxID=856835 RepID=A0A9P7W3C0_9AGAR|nr:MFS general substrate transporter [Guyanagaster necrorhizus MCA 3950]KAG7451888.1 MFS general substrate transporter [Guyanagaster necrorhizus MCA 3950]